jgi:hypothetical protein
MSYRLWSKRNSTAKKNPNLASAMSRFLGGTSDLDKY